MAEITLGTTVIENTVEIPEAVSEEKITVVIARTLQRQTVEVPADATLSQVLQEYDVPTAGVIINCNGRPMDNSDMEMSVAELKGEANALVIAAVVAQKAGC